MNTEIQNALEVLQNGGIILYPTDTVWGIGCDASNEEAVKKVYALKQREESKSMIVLMNNEKMLYNVFRTLPEVVWDVIDSSDKPITVILDNPKNVAANLITEDNSLGVRIVKDPFCYKLMERLKRPLVSTSANLTGMFAPKSFKEISPEILKGVDYVVNLHKDKVWKNPSTIIKLGLDSQVKIIRK